jgi:hypothetical protein
MDEQPAHGVHGSPGKLARDVLEEGQRFALVITEEKKPQALSEPPLKPLGFGGVTLMLETGDATDATVVEVFRTDLVQCGLDAP